MTTKLLPPLKALVGGFVRRTWLVTLVAVLVCAVFAARAVAAYVEADRMPPLPSSPPVAAKATPAPTAPAIDPDVISERNIFCSSCTPRGPGSSNAYSGHPAILIATSLGDAPRATVRVVPTDAQGSWGVEDTIPGVGRIARIGGTSIDVVDEDGHNKTISLLDATAPAAGQGGAATPNPAPAAASPFADRVKKLSDGSYEVDRGVVRELVGMGGQKTGVRAIPVMQKGEITGLRFSGVTNTSIAAAIGIQRGDVLSSIDGEPIKTAQQLLDIYSKLDKLNGVELQGTRAGKPLAIQLRFK